MSYYESNKNETHLTDHMKDLINSLQVCEYIDTNIVYYTFNEALKYICSRCEGADIYANVETELKEYLEETIEEQVIKDESTDYRTQEEIDMEAEEWLEFYNILTEGGKKEILDEGETLDWRIIKENYLKLLVKIDKPTMKEIEYAFLDVISYPYNIN